MIKKSLYPKTKRKSRTHRITVTEKMNGSNIGFFNLNGKLIIAQRNVIFSLDDIDNPSFSLYGGLREWLMDNGDDLLKSLYENSGVFAEWMYERTGKYDVFIFAKARITKTFKIENMKYERDTFRYAFYPNEYVIPEYLSLAPLVLDVKLPFDIKVGDLDSLYEEYSMDKDYLVEGFVIYNHTYDYIDKYIRAKRGVKEEHMDEDELIAMINKKKG